MEQSEAEILAPDTQATVRLVMDHRGMGRQAMAERLAMERQGMDRWDMVECQATIVLCMGATVAVPMETATWEIPMEVGCMEVVVCTTGMEVMV